MDPKKAIEYIKAELSPSVDDATFDKRMETCLQCPALVTKSNGDTFCGACGCGQWARAELKTKLRMSKAKCPKKLW